MIDNQFNEIVQVNRFVDVVGTNKKTLSIHIAELKCHIQPLDPTIDENRSGSFGKDFLMFCGSADIIEGDRVLRDIDESGEGREYKVVGVEKFDFANNQHMEVQIRIFES